MTPLRTLLFLPVLLLALPVHAEEKFTLRDGDRVVLVGNTLIEREQRYGYWEALLTSRFPDRNVTFRNLGWSGDNVWGEARAGFGSVADGFRQLKDHVRELKPTVILVGYGSNEAFDGPEGLPRFEQGLKTLLDTLAETKARIVLLSPLRQEDLGRPLPDPTRQNENLRLYSEALRKAADQRGYAFVDLYTPLWQKPPLTDNGIHLTGFGYWRFADVLRARLGLPPAKWRITLDATAGTATADRARVKVDPAHPLRFEVTDNTLPAPPPEGHPRFPAAMNDFQVIVAKGLPPGQYQLTIDGVSITKAPAGTWEFGVPVLRGPDYDQAERLRETIVAKNREYFHRWRPENETYLFGFRKHEQGQNAREIPQFDPIVARLEADIARLRVPQPHTYELKKSE